MTSIAIKMWPATVGLAALVAFCGFARPAHAQQMNFSYYTDAASNDSTLFTMVGGYDNSTGCTHYDYQNTAYVSGPGGYFDESSGPGMSSYFNMPLAGIGSAGSYSVWSNVTVNCSCFGSGLGAGGGSGEYTLYFWGVPYVRDPSSCSFDPETATTWCTYIKASCNHVCSGAASLPSFPDNGPYMQRFGYRLKGYCTPGWSEGREEFPQGGCDIFPIIP